MQKKNCVLCISIGIIVCILLSACSRQPDFDAKSYVQSSLDAHYHGEYKDYANLLEISEKDAKKEIEEDFNESIQQQFDDSDNITDKAAVVRIEKYQELYRYAMEINEFQETTEISLGALRRNVSGFVAPQMYIYLDGTELLDYIENKIEKLDGCTVHDYSVIKSNEVCVH